MIKGNRQDRKKTGVSRDRYVFPLIFVLLAAGIIVAALSYQKSYEERYRTEIECRLSVIADTKVSELSRWRQERLADASILLNNDALSLLARKVLQQPPDADAQQQLAAWMGKYLEYNEYDRVYLLDARGAVRMAVPDIHESMSPHLERETAEFLNSSKLAFVDFHRDVPNGPVNLAVLVPIFDTKDAQGPLGALVLQIDPGLYLYPFIQRWPTPSSTAETLLVRRDGDDALFLNELRFRQNAALSFREPLTRRELPAARAVLGHEGVVEGVDYRGVPVIAALRTVPDSPWFLVARMDTSEVYGPFKEREWLTVAFVSVLILTAGLGTGLVWRRLGMRLWKEKAQAAEALRHSEARYRMLFDSAKDAIFLLQGERFVQCNPKGLEMYGCRLDQIIGRTPFDFSPARQPDGRPSAEKGREILQAALAGVGQFFEWQHCRLDGTVFDAEVSVNRLDIDQQPMVMAVVRDITDRKRVLEALRVSEEQLRQAARVAGLGIFEHDQITDKIQWSDKLREIAGWEPGAEVGLRDWIDLIHPEDRPRIAEAIRLAHDPAGDGRYSVEHRIVRRDGSLRWVSVRSQTFFDGEGPARRPVRTIGATLDITERKQAQEAVENGKRYADAIIESMPGVFYLFDKQGRFLRWNKNFETVTGYSPADLAGLHALDCFAGTDRELMSGKVQEVFSKGSGEAEANLVLKNGQRIPYYFTGLRIAFDQKPCIMGLGLDITVRKQAEDALRKSEEKFRAIADYTHDWENWVGRDGTLLWVNPGVERMTGYSPQEVMAMRDFPMSLIAEEDRARVQASFQESLGGKIMELPLEFRIRRKDGQILWGSVVVQAIYDDRGQSMGHRSSIRDITERKYAEEELKRTAGDLLRSNQDLEQFAYVASHDLQEPLRMVTSYMDLLQRTYKDRLGKDADEFIAFAVEGANRMRQLIEDLLTFSRITSPLKEPRRVAVQAAFDRAMADLRGRIAESGAEITYDPLPEILGDEIQLAQILINLFGNAIKFRGEQPPRVHLRVRQEGDEWVFSVRDNGIGIAPGNFERIFQVFQRLHTRTKYPGSGIGLAICKRIVERNGGRIWVESQVGLGSTFFFTVPV